MAELRARREKSPNEAELLWHWLARKEIEYYNTCSGPPSESDEKLAARRYVEVHGNMHTKVWTDVSQLDWMIANARKRIEQFQSAGLNPRNAVTWQPSLTTGPTRAKPELSVRLLNEYLKEIKARKDALESTKKQLDRHLPKINPNEHQAAPNSATDEKINVRQWTLDVAKELGDDLEAARLDADVMQRVIDDAERLSEVS